MTEIELIKKIKKLKEIKPRKDWVLLTKNQILGTSTDLSASKEAKFELFPFFKPVYAGFFLFVILISLLEFSQTALPSEPLYYLKRVVEKTQAIFVSEEEKPKVQLEQVNKRLEELTRIAETNQVKKLAPALEAYQDSVAEAAKKITRIAATTSDPSVIKEIAKKAQELEKNKEILEKTYGIAGLEVEEELNPTKVVVEWLIKDLNKRTLSEEQQLIFEEAKKDFEAENYSEALVKILNLSYSQQ